MLLTTFPSEFRRSVGFGKRQRAKAGLPQSPALLDSCECSGLGCENRNPNSENGRYRHHDLTNLFFFLFEGG
jgi:hypothetical protein